MRQRKKFTLPEAFLARHAARAWLKDAEFVSFVGTEPKVTVGLAVPRELFSRIREANGSPRLAEVPPDQDAEEFELHFPGLYFDVLTSKAPEGNGAIARYLSKFVSGDTASRVSLQQCRRRDATRARAIWRDVDLSGNARWCGRDSRELFSGDGRIMAKS